MNSVAIIGAGLTGLTAAFRLRQRGIPATVYEASDRVGGVVQSWREAGYLAEHGPNTLLETSPKITDLIRAAGLQTRRLESDPRAANRYVVRGHRPVALPGTVVQFLGTRLFSLAAKFRLIREPFISRGTEEESVGAFVQRRLGREFLDYAIDPLVSGIYAGDPLRLSVQHAFPRVYDLEQKYGSLIRGQLFGARERRNRPEVSKANARKLSFDQGLQVLPDALHFHVQDAVQLRTPVSGIARRESAWDVVCGSAGTTGTARHSAVLFAGSAYQLPHLRVDTQPAVDLSLFAEIRHPAVASVVLGFRRSDVQHPLDGFGMLVPKVEGLNILGALFNSSLFPNRAPDGHVTLTVYLGGTRHPQLALSPHDRLVALALQDLQLLLGISGPPTFRHVAVFPQAIPQYELGYARFKAALDGVEAAVPGFFLAGNYRNGPSLSDSILSGHEAAEKIAQFLNGSGTQPTRPTPAQPILTHS